MEQKQTGKFTFSILLLIFGYAFVTSTPSLFTNGFINDFHITDLELGFVGSIVNVGGLIALITVPLLQGRVKKWSMLLTGALVQAAMLFCLGVTPVFWLLLAAYLVMGLGMGWLDSYGNSSIVDINRENSTKYMSMLHGTYGIGSLMSPIIIQALLTIVIWRSVSFFVAGLVALTAAVFVILTRKGSNAGVTALSEPKLKFPEIKAYLKEKYNLLLIGGGVMYNATMSVSAFWVVRYSAETFKDNGAAGALALSVCWIFSTISRFGAPLLKKRPLTMFAAGVSPMGIFLAIGILIGSKTALIAAFGAIGLFSGQCMPMLLSEVNSRYHGRTSLPTSVNLFAMYIARILMPLAAGLAAALTSVTVSMFMPLVTGLLGGAFALSAIRMEKASESVEKSCLGL